MMIFRQSLVTHHMRGLETNVAPMAQPVPVTHHMRGLEITTQAVLHIW